MREPHFPSLQMMAAPASYRFDNRRRFLNGHCDLVGLGPPFPVCSKDLCGADDGDDIRQKKPHMGRLTSGNLHWLNPGREACESVPLSARLLPTMSRGHLPNDRDLVAGLGLFLL